MPGGQPAEDRCVAAGSNSSKVGGEKARRRVADSVNARVDPDQEAVSESSRYLPPGEAGGKKLGTGDDTMRLRSDLRADLRRILIWGTHTVPNRPKPLIRPLTQPQFSSLLLLSDLRAGAAAAGKLPPRSLQTPSRARSKKVRKSGGQMSDTQSRQRERPVRYSPELPWRPRVSPPSVEDKDACAIYASVRKDATPSHEPIELAIASLQKMLHRAGNVDGEGDGCGLLLDIPRRIWAEEVRAGGHDPSLTLDPAFAVAHVFIERSQDLEKVRHDARELLGHGGFRILAERVGEVDSQALGPTAREEEPHFWQVAGLVADAPQRDRVLFDLLIELERSLGLHVPSFSATTCVYKVMGAPKILGTYYPDLHDERAETIGCFGHNRYSTNTWPSFKRVQPFSVLGHNGEINTIEQLRQEARMLGVPIEPGCSDSQDLNRTVDTLIRREGLSLAEAMELVVPAIVDEIRSLPERLHRFYMYMRQAMGPFAQGPVALIARHEDECVFSADALGLRPLWQVETRRRLRLFLRAGRRLGARDGLRAQAPRPGREGPGADRPRGPPLDPARPRRDAGDRPRALAGADRRRGGGAL